MIGIRIDDPMQGVGLGANYMSWKRTWFNVFRRQTDPKPFVIELPMDSTFLGCDPLSGWQYGMSLIRSIYTSLEHTN